MIHDPFGRRSSHHSESQQLTFTNKRGYNRTPSTVTHKLRWGLGSSCLVKCRSSDCHTAAFLKPRIMCNVKGSLSFTEANWHLQMMGKLLPRVRHTFGVNERRKKTTTERSSQTQARNTVGPIRRGYPGELQEASKPMHLTLAEILLTDTIGCRFQFLSHPFFKGLPQARDMDTSF